MAAEWHIIAIIVNNPVHNIIMLKGSTQHLHLQVFFFFFVVLFGGLWNKI
jgi:hypothetical protein